MPRFSLKHLLFGFVIIAIGFSTLIVLKRAFDPFDDVAFTRVGWARASDEERARMSRDLIRNHLRPGLSKSDVKKLLGENGIVASADYGGIRLLGADAVSYYLGGWSEAGLDAAFLFVHFDANGRVIGAEVTGY